MKILLGLVLFAALLVGVTRLYVTRMALPLVGIDGLIPEEAEKDTTMMGGFIGVRPLTSDADLTNLLQIIEATPNVKARYRVDGPIKFIARSKVFRFPDLVEVYTLPDRVVVASHLVVGKSDLGVNKKRVLDWFDAAKLSTPSFGS